MSMLFAILQFTSLAMLGWLAAAAAPILIHLFTRRRFKKVTWAAMEYLMAAMKKNRRRIQIEQLLLLGVRVLILILLALALADPVFSRSNLLSFGGTTPPTHHIFMIDASYSMDLRREGVTRFEAAREAVRQVVENAAQGDGYSLVLLADPPRVIIGEPAFDKNDLLDELNSTNLTHGLGDFEATLTEIESIASAARKQHDRLGATAIRFYGDLEQTTWNPAVTEPAKERLKKLGANYTVSVIDLGLEDVRNTAMLSAEVHDTPVTLDRPFTIQAEIAAYGEGSKGKKLVTLVVDGEALTQHPVELDSGGRGSVAFTHRFSSTGDHTVELRLPEDALRVDNARFLSIPVRESLKVLCVYSRPGETEFVALALEPEQSPKVRVQVKEAGDSALLDRDLSQYDVVVLTNLPTLDSEQQLAIESYVKAGGGLVVFPGDQTKVGEAPPDFYPASLDAIAPAGDYRFTPLEYRHELVAPFRGFEKSGLLTTPIWKYVKLTPTTDHQTRVALSLTSGDPAIVEGRFGRGRVTLFAISAANNPLDPWSGLPSWPSFPPLIQESLSLATRSREEGRNRLVGDTLSSLIHNATGDTPLNITPPNTSGRGADRIRSAARPVRLESDGDVWRWSFGDTLYSGIYDLKIGPPLDTLEKHAVNIDAQESALDRIDPALLPAQFLSTSDAPSTSSAASASGATAAYPWFRPLLLGVLALLAAETFLARWFGGGRL